MSEIINIGMLCELQHIYFCSRALRINIVTYPLGGGILTYPEPSEHVRPGPRVALIRLPHTLFRLRWVIQCIILAIQIWC